jgi:hypothetical protein
MGHKAESENPLRVKMHGGDEAVVVARNVKDDHIPTAGYLNPIRRPIHLSQRRKVFELRRFNECQPSRQGRCSGGMFACPQAHGHGLDDFHSLGQNVLSWAFRQESMEKEKASLLRFLLLFLIKRSVKNPGASFGAFLEGRPPGRPRTRRSASLQKNQSRSKLRGIRPKEIKNFRQTLFGVACPVLKIYCLCF